MLPINKTMILQRIPFRLILILGIFMLGVISPAEAQEKLLRTLTVTGEGVENIATSLAEGSLGIEISGRSASEVQKEIDRAEKTTITLEPIERFAFYERAKKAYCVIATGETRFYGCFVFKKGVIPPK
jgi:hypothetical protein